MSRTCVEQNDRLEMTISGETGYREVGYELKRFVVAAFKAEISFSSFSATLSGSLRAGFKLEYRIDDNNYVSVDRYKTGTGSDGYSSSICVDGVLTTTATGTIADASGKLKIERTGMIVRTYYWDGAAYVIIDSNTEFDTSVGKMKLVSYADATTTMACNADDFIIQESANSLYDSQFAIKDSRGGDKISVARRGHRDYKNKVTVQYSKRGYGYMAGTVDCQDLVDIDANGVMDVAMRLEAICTLSRADKMGRLFLKKNVNQCEVYAGILGPQSFGTTPGNIVYLSSKKLDMSNVPARALAVKEGNDYHLEVEFSEEKEIYELDSYAWDNTSPVPNPQYSISTSQGMSFAESVSVSASTETNIDQSDQVAMQEGINAETIDPSQIYVSAAADTMRVSETPSIIREMGDLSVYDGYRTSEDITTGMPIVILVDVPDSMSCADTPEMAFNFNINSTDPLYLAEGGVNSTWDSAAKHSNITLSESDLKESSSTVNARSVRAIIGKSSGKWYFEYTILTGDDQSIGICTTAFDPTSATNAFWSNVRGYAYLSYNGNKGNNGSSSGYGSSWTAANDVVMVAYDLDANKIWFGKNGTWQASGDPAAGTGQAYSTSAGYTYYPIATIGSTGSNPSGRINLGNTPFKYTVPSGFSALARSQAKLVLEQLVDVHDHVAPIDTIAEADDIAIT